MPAIRCLVSKSIPVILWLIFNVTIAEGQEHYSYYNILHDGEIKGTLVLYQKIEGTRVHIRIESEVKTRFLFRIIVKSIEEAVFDNGNMIYSSLHRLVNGEERTNRQLRSTGNSYEVTDKEDIIALPAYPIHFSILSLYCQEPVNISRVYSDNYGQYVEVMKLDNNRYRIKFPNGNTNYYSYKNGICIRVEVEQFYNMEFRLED